MRGGEELCLGDLTAAFKSYVCLLLGFMAVHTDLVGFLGQSLGIQLPQSLGNFKHFLRMLDTFDLRCTHA